jgi:hypothetical protein
MSAVRCRPAIQSSESGSDARGKLVMRVRRPEQLKFSKISGAAPIFRRIFEFIEPVSGAREIGMPLF